MRTSLVLLACVVVGCGGRADGSGSPAPATSAAPPATETPPPDSPAPTIAGNVSLTSAGGQFTVSALFPLAGAPAPETLGPDCISRTAVAASGLDSVSAGDIVVDVATAARRLKLSYDATTRTYEDASFEGTLPPGSPIALRASGSADVPAFDVTGATADAAQLVEPLEGASISRDANDLAVTWTPMQEQLLVASLQIGDTTISCRFGASTGHGVVPGALIRPAVTAADGIACVGSCTSLTVFTGHTTEVTAGAYDVFVTHGAVVAHGLTLAN